MLQFSTWKQAAIILTCLIGVLLVVPNFLSKETLDSLPRWVPKTQLSLGLDLRGGAHLLLSMETADVRKDWLETLRDDARRPGFRADPGRHFIFEGQCCPIGLVRVPGTTV